MFPVHRQRVPGLIATHPRKVGLVQGHRIATPRAGGKCKVHLEQKRTGRLTQMGWRSVLGDKLRVAIRVLGNSRLRESVDLRCSSGTGLVAMMMGEWEEAG